LPGLLASSSSASRRGNQKRIIKAKGALLLASFFAPRRCSAEIFACRGEGIAVGPLLAARALPLPGVGPRCQY
jgi:hypothetical protein